jgi:adenylate cyclase
MGRVRLPGAAPRMTLASFLPADRRHALAAGMPLPVLQNGVALFADIGGFTQLAEALQRVLGPQSGAEKLSSIINRIFDALVLAVDNYHGSIIVFSGDAITCWFEADDGRLAAKCALEMQSAMYGVGHVNVAGIPVTSVGLKVTVAAGTTRRFQIGEPRIQLLDCIVGRVVDRLAAGEHLCRVGDVLVDDGIAERLGTLLNIDGWREEGGARFARVTGLAAEVPKRPWAIIPDGSIAPDALRVWILPPLYDRLQSGQSRFLAEFRPIAALFLKFSGLEYDANPHAHEHLDAFVRWAMAVVVRHGGLVFQVTMGDKGSHFLAVFGAPVAHGGDVRRAIDAAHELRHPPETLLGIRDVRIGVNTGRAYAGLYSGLRSFYAVTGDAVNLAARLMEAAESGQVLVSAHAATALDRRFAIRALDPIKVKGRSAPAAICELLGPAAACVRLSEPRFPLPIVGRTNEIGIIAEAVGAARSGCGRVLAFCADAGMGKSRLVNEAIQRATAASFACFAGECQPYGTATGYLPWLDVWNGLFGLVVDDPPDRRQQRLAEALGKAAVLAPLLDRVLDLPMVDNDTTRPMPVSVRKQTLEQLLAEWLRGRASLGPVCIVLEECHWIDSVSQDLLSAIAGAVADRAVLIVLAYRPAEIEDNAHFRIDRVPNLTEVRLSELIPSEALRLVAMLTAHLSDGSVAISEGLTHRLVERADGNPYYIEELVRYVFQSPPDLTREAALEQLELPASVESLILQRIDRLSERQQRAVKVSSVIGRRFSVDWLLGAYANTIDAANTRRDLEHICQAGLTVVDTPLPQLAYLFRHAIVREVAYETLSYSLRQELHERLAQYLEGLSGGRRPVDLLAYHYAHSANRSKEAEYRQLAAELAIQNGAYGEALQHVRRASEIVAVQTESLASRVQELELQLLRGTILLVMEGQGSLAAKGAYDRARDLARAVTPGPALGRAIFGLWTYYLFQGLMQPAGALADEAVALTMRSPDSGVRIMAQLAECQTHLWTGQWLKCAEHFNQVLALYDPSLHETYITQYAQNPRFTATGSGFWALWALGRRDGAAAAVDTAIFEAAALNHDFTYVIAYLNRPLLAYLERRPDLLATSIAELVRRAQRVRNPFYVALALAFDAWSKVMSGQHEDGLTQLAEQDATMCTLGSKLVEPLITSMLAEGYLHANRLDEGLAILDERFDLFVEQGRLSLVPEHLRLRAELLLARSDGNHEMAVHHLRRAIAIAREHKALSLELRAAISLAHVLRRRGHQAEAAALINPVCRAFCEGLESTDLREAAEFLRPA